MLSPPFAQKLIYAIKYTHRAQKFLLISTLLTIGTFCHKLPLNEFLEIVEGSDSLISRPTFGVRAEMAAQIDLPKAVKLNN
jgi:hypothetical protein